MAEKNAGGVHDVTAAGLGLDYGRVGLVPVREEWLLLGDALAARVGQSSTTARANGPFYDPARRVSSRKSNSPRRT